MVLESIFGLMERYFKVTFKMGRNKDKENGKNLISLKLINIKDNIQKIKNKDLELINGKMEINI